MNDRIAMHVIYRTQDLEDNAGDSCLRQRFSLALSLQVAGRKQLQYQVHSFLIVKETIQ